ncbi:MAG: dpp5 [Rhizobacter sp.]|nr:dpp5 [Rhizobacter sp.]
MTVPAALQAKTAEASSSVSSTARAAAPAMNDVALQFALISESATAERINTGLLQVDIGTAVRERSLAQAMDKVRDDAEVRETASKQIVVSSAAVSAGLSIGYVVWLARGGALLGSMMSALPAWHLVDPLPVLSQVRRRGESADPTDGDGSDGHGTHGDNAGGDSRPVDEVESLFATTQSMPPPPLPTEAP